MIVIKEKILCLSTDFSSKHVEDINLSGILNAWDVKHTLPSNLNYKNNPIKPYVLKTIGLMIFNNNLTRIVNGSPLVIVSNFYHL